MRMSDERRILRSEARPADISGEMILNVSGADGSVGPPLGDRAFWDADSTDYGCDCPGPPPKFYLPPPPRPYFVVDSDCTGNSTSHLEICEAVPVIDAEFHYSPAIPSFAIILTAVAAVVVFLFIGTFLVLIKRRKMQNLLPRKSSSQNRCDSASTNGVIYEDLTNLRPRTLSSLCPPGQTTLPSIEMLDTISHPEQDPFTPVFIRSPSPVQDPYESRELFNPVYEELSNGSGEGDETDSEGIPQTAVSEDEFAEDELSLAGEDVLRQENENPDHGFPQRSVNNDACRDVDSSDADDKCKFLENSQRNLSLPSDHLGKGKRNGQGSYLRGAAKRPKSLDRKKVWKNKALPPLPVPPVDCSDFHEGFVFKRIMQIYPDVTGVGFQYSRGLPTGKNANNVRTDGGRFENFETFGSAQPRYTKPEIFSNFGRVQKFSNNQSQDSSLGSDSGYSNNTSGGKPSLKTRKEYRLSNLSDNLAFS